MVREMRNGYLFQLLDLYPRKRNPRFRRRAKLFMIYIENNFTMHSSKAFIVDRLI